MSYHNAGFKALGHGRGTLTNNQVLRVYTNMLSHCVYNQDSCSCDSKTERVIKAFAGRVSDVKPAAWRGAAWVCVRFELRKHGGERHGARADGERRRLRLTESSMGLGLAGNGTEALGLRDSCAGLGLAGAAWVLGCQEWHGALAVGERHGTRAGGERHGLGLSWSGIAWNGIAGGTSIRRRVGLSGAFPLRFLSELRSVYC